MTLEAEIVKKDLEVSLRAAKEKYEIIEDYRFIFSHKPPDGHIGVEVKHKGEWKFLMGLHYPTFYVQKEEDAWKNLTSEFIKAGLVKLVEDNLNKY